MTEFEEKCQRNARVQARYDELMREGKHGHYETMFRVVHEEVEAARQSTAPSAEDVAEAVRLAEWLNESARWDAPIPATNCRAAASLLLKLIGKAET